MRKFLSIFLAVAMLASMLAVPALAAAGDKVYDVPGSFLAATDYTNKLAEITSSGKKFVLKGASGKATTIESVTIENTALFEYPVDDSDALKLNADGSVTINQKAGAKDVKGAVSKVTLTGKDADGTAVTAFFFAQFGAKVSDDELTAISIKTPATSVLVAGGELKLEVEKTPKGHTDEVYWFSNRSVVTFKGDDNVGSSVIIEADDVDGTTPVTIKAISQNGKTDEITIYVVQGVDATSIAFAKNLYTVVGKEEETVVAETIVTPSNGKTTDRTVAPADGKYKTADDKVEFTVDNLGELEITKVADGAEFPYVVVLKATVSGVVSGAYKKDGLTATTVVTITAPEAGKDKFIQLENTPTSGKLAIGQAFQYKAAVYDNDPIRKDAKVISDAKIEWFSSKPSVATVDKATGVVTAVSEGTTTIYATSAGAKTTTAGVKEANVKLTVVKTAATGAVKYVKAGTLTVRALASSSSIKLGELKQGALVDVLEISGAWAKVAYAGSYAYVAAEHLSDPVTFTVTSTTLAVRSFPGATATLKSLKYGETVKVIGKYAANSAWTAILLDDTTVAYVASQHVVEGGGLMGIVNAGSLTFRASASTTSAAYANKLVKGQAVEILGKEGSFLKVKTAEGFVGYAAAAYITIL